MVLLQIQYEVDLSNVVGILINIGLGFYLAYAIPKKLSSNRTEQDLLIEELKLILTSYRDVFDMFSKTSLTTGVNFDILKDNSERNTAKLYSFINLTEICEFSNNLRVEILELQKLDRNLRKCLTGVSVSNGFFIYKPSEINSVNTNYDLLSKQLYKFLIKINRKGI
jgi:hypothetical protein